MIEKAGRDNVRNLLCRILEEKVYKLEQFEAVFQALENKVAEMIRSLNVSEDNGNRLLEAVAAVRDAADAIGEGAQDAHDLFEPSGPEDAPLFQRYIQQMQEGVERLAREGAELPTAIEQLRLSLQACDAAFADGRLAQDIEAGPHQLWSTSGNEPAPAI